MIMLQLNPMLPVYVPRFKMEGYAFLVTQFSQEHRLLFCVALNNGEIWELNNTEMKFCSNVSMERDINKGS